MTVYLPRFICGVDPGKRSGIALLDLLTVTCDGVEMNWDRRKYGAYLEEIISTYRPAVVGETFVMNANTVRNTQAPWSLKALGVAEDLAWKYDCTYLEQAQSSAKSFATDDRLKALGWYVPGKGHLVDAQRQTLLYAIDHGWWHPALSTSDTI